MEYTCHEAFIKFKEEYFIYKSCLPAQSNPNIPPKLLWDCSCLNKNLLHEEQFSKEQMIAGLFYKDSGMNMNICNISCSKIQSNLCTRKHNYILNLKSEN